jgi:hypothetical protein
MTNTLDADSVRIDSRPTPTNEEEAAPHSAARNRLYEEKVPSSPCTGRRYLRKTDAALSMTMIPARFLLGVASLILYSTAGPARGPRPFCSLAWTTR